MDSISNSNYNVVNINDNFSITLKELEVELANTTISTMDEFELIFLGLVGSDTIGSSDYVITFYEDEFLTSAIEPDLPGTYYFVVSLDMDNYSLSETYDNSFILT